MQSMPVQVGVIDCSRLACNQHLYGGGSEVMIQRGQRIRQIRPSSELPSADFICPQLGLGSGISAHVKERARNPSSHIIDEDQGLSVGPRDSSSVYSYM